MSIQQIRRAKTIPSVSQEAEQWFRNFLLSDYVQLAQQVNAVQTAFQAFQLAVAAGFTTKPVVFTFPYADLNYSMAAMPDWSTTVFFSVKAVGGFTLNFGTAAPGGGGNVTVMTMR
jgi:hypothetical protein